MMEMGFGSIWGTNVNSKYERYSGELSFLKTGYCSTTDMARLKSFHMAGVLVTPPIIKGRPMSLLSYGTITIIIVGLGELQFSPSPTLSFNS